jgi:hypothetical protein
VAAEGGVFIVDGGVAAEGGVAPACPSARRCPHPPPEREKPLDRASRWSSVAVAAAGWSSVGGRMNGARVSGAQDAFIL